MPDFRQGGFVDGNAESFVLFCRAVGTFARHEDFVDAGPELKTVAYAPPPRRGKGVMVKDAAELVATLKAKGLL